MVAGDAPAHPAAHLSGIELDRLPEVRGRGALGGDSVVLTVFGARALLRDGEPVLCRADELDRPPTVFLGERAGVRYAAHSAADDAEAAALEKRTGGRFVGLRTVAAEMDADMAGLYAYAAALLAWHRTARYCGVCGAPTRTERWGHQRVCTRDSCAAVQFPRTDPAIITLPRAGEQCLLIRQPAWPDGRFSTLAGFVEPGETLESAVAREVAEEVGLRVVRTRYAYSQPWPFPHTLMLGFRTEVAPGAVELGDEVAEARWFTRAALRAALAVREITVAPPFALSRTLIDEWLVGIR